MLPNKNNENNNLRESLQVGIARLEAELREFKEFQEFFQAYAASNPQPDEQETPLKTIRN